MKKFLRIVAIVFIEASVLLAAVALPSTAPKLESHGLKSDFLEYNDQFFYGALAKNTTVIWKDLSEYSDMGRTEQRPDGSFVIMVDPKTHVYLQQARMTLFHEMCHEKNLMNINVVAGSTKKESEGLDGHSGAFDSCMLDIAKRGAFKDLW